MWVSLLRFFSLRHDYREAPLLCRAPNSCRIRSQVFSTSQRFSQPRGFTGLFHPVYTHGISRPLKFFPFEDSCIPFGTGYSLVVTVDSILFRSSRFVIPAFKSFTRINPLFPTDFLVKPPPRGHRDQASYSAWYKVSRIPDRMFILDHPKIQKSILSEKTTRLRSFLPLENPSPACKQTGRAFYDHFL